MRSSASVERDPSRSERAEVSSGEVLGLVVVEEGASGAGGAEERVRDRIRR